MERKTAWEVTVEGRIIGTVERLEGDRWHVEVTGVKTSEPSQTFKGRGVLVDYLDWLAPGWHTTPIFAEV